MDIVTWAQESWLIFVAIAAGLGVIIEFVRNIKKAVSELSKPLNEINEKIDAFDKKQDVQSRAILTMQRKSLLDACQFYLQRGFASLDEKSTMSSQYESYHELGGDSFITDLVKEVMKLPIDAQGDQE